MVYETLKWEINRFAVRLTRTDEELTIARAVMPHDERRRGASRVGKESMAQCPMMKEMKGMHKNANTSHKEDHTEQK